MAMTATVALSPSTVVPEQPFTVSLTVANSGAGAVAVLGITPIVEPHGALARSVAASNGVPPLGPNYANSVAAAGNLVISWSDVVHSPQPGGGLANPASYQYDIGALVSCDDGSIFSATTATLTVNAPSH